MSTDCPAKKYPSQLTPENATSEILKGVGGEVRVGVVQRRNCNALPVLYVGVQRSQRQYAALANCGREQASQHQHAARYEEAGPLLSHAT